MIALLLAACADSDEAPPPTTSPTAPATATTEPIITAEEEEPESAVMLPSPRASGGGELELYGQHFRSPINATFYFRERVQSYRLVRTDEQSIYEAECRKNEPFRTDSGHHLLALGGSELGGELSADPLRERQLQRTGHYIVLLSVDLLWQGVGRGLSGRRGYRQGGSSRHSR